MNIVDALVVTLGLDASGFIKGQKETEAQFNKTKDGVVKSGKEIEARAKGAAEAFNKLRDQVIMLFAAFTAGRGIRDFVESVTTATAGIGRMADRLSTTPNALSAWGGAATMAGGSMEGASQSIAGLITWFNKLQLSGDTSLIPALNRMGIAYKVLKDGTLDWNDLLIQINAAMQKLPKAEATTFLQTYFGVTDPGMLALLEGLPSDLRTILAEQQRLGVVTKDDSDAAIALAKGWYALTQASNSLGRTIMTEITPALVLLEHALTDILVFVRQHPAIMNALFAGATVMVAALSGASLLLGTRLFFAAAGMGSVSGALRGTGGLIALFGQLALVVGGAVALSEGLDAAFDSILSKPLDKLNALLFGPKPAGVDPGVQQQYGGSTPFERLMNLWHGSSGAAGGPGSGASSDPDLEAYIRSSAAARGIDPNIAVAVAKSEGLGHAYAGDQGSSYGAFQLHKGGIAPGGNAVSGLGDTFQQQTGLDPSDPSTQRAQVDFAMDWAKTHGWGAWHGWKGLPTAGLFGATNAAQGAALSSGTSNSSTSSLSIGEVNVYTNSTTAPGIARDIRGALRRQLDASDANSGPS